MVYPYANELKNLTNQLSIRDNVLSLRHLDQKVIIRKGLCMLTFWPMGYVGVKIRSTVEEKMKIMFQSAL